MVIIYTLYFFYNNLSLRFLAFFVPQLFQNISNYLIPCYINLKLLLNYIIFKLGLQMPLVNGKKSACTSGSSCLIFFTFDTFTQ